MKDIKVNFVILPNMDTEHTDIQMVRFIMVCSKWTDLMEKDNIIGQMAIFTREVSSITKDMEKEHWNLLRELHIMANSEMIKNVV